MKKNRSYKKSKKGFPVFSVILALLILGGAVYAGLYLERNTIISDVRFSGNYYTNEHDLYNAIESPVGFYADSVNYSKLYNQLKSSPYVSDATVHMNLRGTLTFVITEHEPIAMLVNGSNRVYMAEKGIILPVIPEKIPDVPLVYGLSAASVSDTLTSNESKVVEQFLLEARANEFGWITISEVAWNNSEGVTALTNDNGVKLVFGKDYFKEKFENWEAFYSQVVTQKGMGAFHIIDLRFSDQIVAKH